MKRAILIVLDGFGLAPPGPGNAIYLANPTNINSYFYSFPNTTLKASGEAVGLPSGEVGNTEVGHINMGAGRIVYQDLPRINMSIADGSFYKNPALVQAMNNAKTNNSTLHLIGLVGAGGVHSSIDHLYALLYMAKEQGVAKVRIHAITDGRDSPPKSAAEIVSQLEEKVKLGNQGLLATVMGRYYAMDRDRRWERIEKAYRCLTQGSAITATSSAEAIKNAYAAGKTDEFIEPTSILDETGKPSIVQAGDSVIFFNYRIDRPRELTKAFVLDDFEGTANLSSSFDPYAVKYHKTHLAAPDPNLAPPFKRGPKIQNLTFVTMTEYERNLPVLIAFPPIMVKMPLGRVLSTNNVAQLRMAESEKERFVTFYFNGQNELVFPGEDRVIIPSPKVATYDMKPEMSSYELTQTLLEKMGELKYSFILINYACPDMVGHTGNIEASIKAIKAVDDCLGKIVHAALEEDYAVFITADHGNVEQKINPQTGQVSTEHTGNYVPFIAISKDWQGKYARLQSGILADVAPTILGYLGIPKPPDMTGRNLLEEMH